MLGAPGCSPVSTPLIRHWVTLISHFSFCLQDFSTFSQFFSIRLLCSVQLRTWQRRGQLWSCFYSQMSSGLRPYSNKRRRVHTCIRLRVQHVKKSVSWEAHLRWAAPLGDHRNGVLPLVWVRYVPSHLWSAACYIPARYHLVWIIR